MIPLVTASEMRAIDEVAIQRHGVPSLELMEKAGRGVAEAAGAQFGSVEGRNILVVCGRGNNGGDGLVAARALREAGARVTVVVAAEPGDLSADSRVNAERWKKAGGTILHHATEDALAAFFEDAAQYELVIDALLGTGATGPPRGIVPVAIRGINALDVPVVAVDIPSGIDADSGAVPGDAITADLTVTLAFPKRGHYLQPAREHVGILEIVDIGIPREAALAAPIADFLIEAEDLADLLPRWPQAAHKGVRGRLLVVGGSV